MTLTSTDKLCKSLGYQFNNHHLLEKALTHRSVGKDNYERLEFLGDSILSFVISTCLYNQFPHVDEGKLSRLRATLVKGEQLARMARDLNVGDYLLLGPGELKSGGHRRDSILADTFEALLGAVYLDSDIATVHRLIENLFKELLENIDLDHATKDPKTQLQEYMQSRKLVLPEYEVIETRGEAHSQTFTISCRVSISPTLYTATGNSRRKAEQAVAAIILKEISGG